MRASFGPLRPNEYAGKQWDFDVSFPVVACVAGKFGLCQPIIDELNNRLRRTLPRKRPVYCEHIENAINYARFRIFYRLVDWEMKMGYCVTLKQFQAERIGGKKITRMMHQELVRFVKNHDLKAELVVGGFLANGNILFYKASRKNPIEASTSPGVYVIGTGGTLAMAHLNRRGQNLHDGLLSTLLHISEALDEAQKVSDGTVGHPQALTILHRDGRIERLPAKSQALADWKRAYKNRDITASLDESSAAWDQMKYQLVRHRPKRSVAQRSED